MCQMQDFTGWLQEQLDARDWSKSELSRRSGVDTGSISNVLNGIRRAGPEMCRGFAVALGLPEAVVFYRAGLITQDPQSVTEELDPMALDILRMVADRPEAEQAAIVATVRALVENFDRGKSGNGKDADEVVAGTNET